MRIWKGFEREHNKSYHKPTIFVESSSIDLSQIVNTLTLWFSDESEQISDFVLYLGAGEVDVTEITNISGDAFFLFNSVVIETSCENYENLTDYLPYFDNIIIRFNLPTPDTKYNLRDRTYIKIKQPKCVNLVPFKDTRSTSIASVSDGMYKGDSLIYDDEV